MKVRVDVGLLREIVKSLRKYASLADSTQAAETATFLENDMALQMASKGLEEIHAVLAEAEAGDEDFREIPTLERIHAIAAKALDWGREPHSENAVRQALVRLTRGLMTIEDVLSVINTAFVVPIEEEAQALRQEADQLRGMLAHLLKSGKSNVPHGVLVDAGRFSVAVAMMEHYDELRPIEGYAYE